MATPTELASALVTNKMPENFLVVDDHPMFLEAMKLAIQVAFPDAFVVEASSIDAANRALSGDKEFDLILLDLSMPGTGGFDGLLELRTRYPKLPILIVSGMEDPKIIHQAMTYGAAGFMPKSVRKDELANAIENVMNGVICLPPGYEPPGDGVSGQQQRELTDKLRSLTPQQLRVLRMLREGLLNKQIAYELQVGESTVKAHVSEILRKLNVASRTQAVIAASSIDFENIADPGVGNGGSQ
jgi:DNA-binding NarL/FixJ family response regulator